MNSSQNSQPTKPLQYSTQIVWYLSGLLQTLLIFRFVLKLTGANPEAGFTNFIYTATRPFVAPFLTVFPISTVDGSVFEWTTLLAMLVYLLIAIALVQFILIIGKKVSAPESAEKDEE